MSRSRVYEILPAAFGNCATEESREIERVLEVYPTIFAHSLHLLQVDSTKVLSLNQHLDKQVPQSDHLNGVTTHLEQTGYICSELLLLESRVECIFLILLHLQLLLEIFVRILLFKAIHVDITYRLFIRISVYDSC